MCGRDWLSETKLGRLLLSCEVRPRMKSRYWLSCVRRGGPLLRHWVIGQRLAVILTGALGQELAGRRSDLFTGIVSGFRRKGVATGNGWLCSELGGFSPMSCEVELFRTTVV